MAQSTTYRPELRVLDCTIRDGGLVNDHQFSDQFVRAVYTTCLAAGVDYMEVGYKDSPEQFPLGKNGPWRHCEEADLTRVFNGHDSEATKLKLSAMADTGKSDWRRQIVPRDQSVLDMIRVAFYAYQLPEAIEMINYAAELGYETSANLMAVSDITEMEIDTVLRAVRDTQVDVMVIVDSFGHLYREQIDYLYEKYSQAVSDDGTTIGIHAHNNQQLAFANTIEAIKLGANLADATMGGLGRGAGNCPMELLLGFLRDPKFKLRPVIELIQDYVEPLRSEFCWGPLVPFNITGQVNCHPRAAIKFLASENRREFVRFFDEIESDN